VYEAIGKNNRGFRIYVLEEQEAKHDDRIRIAFVSDGKEYLWTDMQDWETSVLTEGLEKALSARNYPREKYSFRAKYEELRTW